MRKKVYQFCRSMVWSKVAHSYGLWGYANKILTYFTEKVDYIIIGRVLGAMQLGYYERAYNIMTNPRNQLQKSINNVLFSSFSKIEDEQRIINGLGKVVGYIALLSYSIFVWLYFAAPSLITVLYGTKWRESIEPVQIMCVSGYVYSLTFVFNPVLNARALVAQRAARRLIYLLVLTVAICLGVNWGIQGAAWGITVSSAFFLFLTLRLFSRHLSFTFREFFFAQRSAFIYGIIQIITLLTTIFSPGRFHLIRLRCSQPSSGYL